MKKTIIGLTEEIIVYGQEGNQKQVKARIDTGATKSSIDTKLAANIIIGPVKSIRIVKSAHGQTMRPIVEADIELKGKHIKTSFTIADRSHMKYKILIGQNTLCGNDFYVDPDIK